jgi:hypothetical protein
LRPLDRIAVLWQNAKSQSFARSGVILAGALFRFCASRKRLSADPPAQPLKPTDDNSVRLFNLSELVDQPSRSHTRVEALIDEGETIADGIRREFR